MWLLVEEIFFVLTKVVFYYFTRCLLESPVPWPYVASCMRHMTPILRRSMLSIIEISIELRACKLNDAELIGFFIFSYHGVIYRGIHSIQYHH